MPGASPQPRDSSRRSPRTATRPARRSAVAARRTPARPPPPLHYYLIGVPGPVTPKHEEVGRVADRRKLRPVGEGYRSQIGGGGSIDPSFHGSVARRANSMA